MKNTILLTLLLFSIVFTNCKKDDKISIPENQYLFDGLPYYLTDTLFNEKTYPDEMDYLPYKIEFDSKGFAWILDIAGFLSRYNPSTKELIWWNSKEVLGTDDIPYNMGTIFIDSNDRIWCGNNGGGELYLFEGNSARIMSLDDIPQNMCVYSEIN